MSCTVTYAPRRVTSRNRTQLGFTGRTTNMLPGGDFFAAHNIAPVSAGDGDDRCSCALIRAGDAGSHDFPIGCASMTDSAGMLNAGTSVGHRRGVRAGSPVAGGTNSTSADAANPMA